MMNVITTSGTEYLLHTAEKQCPMNYWVSELKNLALSIIKKYHLRRFIGKKYSAEDFWGVLILHTLMDLSIDEASTNLNADYWEKMNRRLRKKKYPKQFAGEIPRKERMVPNGDQVRKYRNTLPMWLTKKLNSVIFDAQLQYALEMGLISKELCVIIDDNDEWYYGNDRFPANQYINKSNKGPGTSRRRKYCAVMVRSKNTSLFIGTEIIRKHCSNVPFILNCIDRLILTGFKITFVMGDRWFPTYSLLSALHARSIKYIGPYKKWSGIKKQIIDYLENGGDYVRNYTIKGAPAKFYHSPKIQVTLIFTNRQGRRLRDIRADYLHDRSTLTERIKEIMVMMTTFIPPKGSKRRQGWAVGICRKYDRRWQIETGFKDLNRMGPPSNSRTNSRKYFMRSSQYWVYNAWQLERAKRRKMKAKFKSWKRGPTFRHFATLQVRMNIAIQAI